MTEKRYVTNDIVKFDYSEIWRKSDDKMYTDTPLRNDEVIKLLNENEQLKKKLRNIQEHIDDTIKKNEEAIEWGKNINADVGAMGFYTHMLKKMKKEYFE